MISKPKFVQVALKVALSSVHVNKATGKKTLLFVGFLPINYDGSQFNPILNLMFK
jgi:hypothetical protein